MGSNTAAESGREMAPGPPADAQCRAGGAQLTGPTAKCAATSACASASTPAASDSSGAENGCHMRLALRQSSFASTDTGQQMTPPPPDARPQQPAPQAASAAASVQPAPSLAVATCSDLRPAGSGGGGDSVCIAAAAAAAKLEPMPYESGGSGSGGGGGGVLVAVKAEGHPQVLRGHQAAARALSNRQSAARSKVCLLNCRSALGAPSSPLLDLVDMLVRH